MSRLVEGPGKSVTDQWLKLVHDHLMDRRDHWMVVLLGFRIVWGIYFVDNDRSGRLPMGNFRYCHNDYRLDIVLNN